MVDIARISKEHNIRIAIHWWESKDKQHNAMFVYISRMIFSGPRGDYTSEFLHNGVLTDTMNMTDEEFDFKLNEILADGIESLNKQEKEKKEEWQKLKTYFPPSILWSRKED